MFGDRTPSEGTGTEDESGRRGRPGSLLLVAIAGALLLVGLAVRRREESTLEPPF